MTRATLLVIGLFFLASVDGDVSPTSTSCELAQQIEDLKARIAALEASDGQSTAMLQGPGAPPRKHRRAGLASPRKLSNVDLVALQDTANGLVTCLNYMWLLICGALVMLMQVGFAIVESGTCRLQNSGTILLKNILDACSGAIVWWAIGYGFAYGEGNTTNTFVGNANFFAIGFTDPSTDHHLNWFFQWAFCATSATIVSGAVAGRINFVGYVIFTIVMTGLIYPFIVYWTWSGRGWLTEEGYSDFAGSGIVHLCGGISALVGAIFVGPRHRRFEEGAQSEFQPHSFPMVVMGTFILWFGWYGFNCGSTLAFSDEATARLAALCAMNTTLAAAAGGIAVLLLRLRGGFLDLAGTCNGILGGLVAICAGVDVMDPGPAILTGLIAGVVQELAHVCLIKLKIDDPVDAFAVHGSGGIVGLILRALFDRQGVDTTILGANILGAVVIILWAGGLSALTFMPLRLVGLLKVTAEEQDIGGDATHLGITHKKPFAATDATDATKAAS